jgi:hypothetical protein
MKPIDRHSCAGRRAILGVLCVLAGSISGAEPDVSPVLSRKGKLLFRDSFDKTEIRPEWKPLHGTQWSIIDGTLRGMPSTKEYREKQIARGNKKHSGGTPSSRLMVTTDDCIVLFRVKLSNGLKGVHFGFNDGSVKTGTGHVCRFTATVNTGMTLQKDKNAKLKGDDDETLVTNEFNLQPDKWYWMMLEIVGDQMAAQVSDGPVLKVCHSRFDIRKDQINLPTRGGGTVYYDDIHVWQAFPIR